MVEEAEGGGAMKCPLKFGLYEFEGGEECIGAECGFYGAVCRNDDSEPLSDVSAADVDANDASEALDSREKLEEDVREWANAFNSALDDDYSEEVINAGHIAMIHCWLDRQAAITERECLVQSVQGADAILTAENAELQAKVDKLTAQLRASNAERARLRECLGIATDNAHDLLTLVDESGNVYDRDEGLA